MILIVKHISIEGAGLIADFLKKLTYNVKTIELDNADKFPDSLHGIKAAVILGGPMNVYEEERYPFLKNEDVF